MHCIVRFIEPKVLQSGFEITFCSLAWRILGKLPANFSANFDDDFLLGKFFGLVFLGLQAPTKNSRQKFTPRIVGIPLQFHFLEPQMFSRRFSAYGGDQRFGCESDTDSDRAVARNAPRALGPSLPKGPFRTKNAMALESVALLPL